MADIKLKSLLNELTFRNQAAFDKYNSSHKLRNSTKVTINGKQTTVGAAEKKKPNSMFGADYKKDRGGDSPEGDKKMGILDTLKALLFGKPDGDTGMDKSDKPSTNDTKPADTPKSDDIPKADKPNKDDAKPKKPKKTDSTRRTSWDRKPGAPYAEDDKFWADRFLAGDKVAGQIATEEDFNLVRSAKIQFSLTDWFKAKDKKDFNYKISEPTESGYVRISSEDGPVDLVMFSDDRNGTFNFGFVDNDGDEAEFTFGNNEVFGGWEGYDNPQYVYQAMRYIMAQPETIQLLRGELTAREYKPMYEKFKKELEPPKKTNENKMKNITLKSLLEAEDFQARSKETGKLVHFKSKDAYQAAIKAGSHEDPKAKKGEEPKAAAKSNSMFGGDYAKDRGAKTTSNASVDGQTDDELYDALYDMGYDFGELDSDDFDEEGFADAAMNLGYRWDDKNKVWNHRDTMGDEAPKADTPKGNFPKKASQLKYKHSESLEKALNAETGLEGIADIDDNGAIIYNASDGSMPTYTLYMGSNIDYGNPDEFRVSLESTYANDPADLSGKVDKTFKSADEAMVFAIAVAKKYKKELQMDIDDANESTKLTSMIKK
jgi:hypothetical protein